MIKALRTEMTGYGAIGILFGLVYVLLPRQSAAVLGFNKTSTHLVSTKTAIGASLIVISIFVMIAARDPVKNKLWVKFAIVFAILFFTVSLSSVLLGYTNFSQSIVGIALHAGFAIALLATYGFSDLSWVYDLIYRGHAPWEMDRPRQELVGMVEDGQLEPCRAIDLGCGTGDNAIYLAQKGFDVVGVDLSSRAVSQAKEKARVVGVSPTFIVGDVTDLRDVEGPFDLVLDYGCLGCVIGRPARERYAETLIRITRHGSKYILLNLTGDTTGRLNLIPNAIKPGEVERIFGDDFDIELYDDKRNTGPMGMKVEFRLMRRSM